MYLWDLSFVDVSDINKYNVQVKLKFSWDLEKDKANQKKHGVSFTQASEVFFNFPLEVFEDPEHSADEQRYIAAGFSNKGRLLLVVHCESRTGTEIRIISARKATRREQFQIFGGKK
jgi:uncharacterized DUF497 family protein